MRGRRKKWLVAPTVVLALLANAAVAEAGKPAVRSIAPTSGATTGGTETLIEGERLLPAGVESCAQCTDVVVRFGTSTASVLAGSQGQLRVLAPAHAAGTVEVTVTTSEGTSASGAGVSDGFTYITVPRVTVTSPASGSITSGDEARIAGEAGVEAGDLPTITVTLFAGAATQTPLAIQFVQASSGSWSATFGALGPGTYTVRAEQRDEAGAVGASDAVTFTLDGAHAARAGPPVASFNWFPAVPQMGELTSLVSSSSDLDSPLVTFAWDLTDSGVFYGAGPLVTTTFATPGDHVVRLRVTGADGLSSIAAETIAVSPQRPILMQPFPVVRILGTYGAFGAKLVLLTVEAPANALITVRCRGHGCPVRLARRVAPSSASGLAVVAFRRFERRLPAGVRLVVRVSAPGEIGKYTRFVIRRGKVPQRFDACLGPSDPGPVACPSS
jgi:IPT/TIG domain/PKD domain/Bacterial Ig-like domain